MLNKNKNSQYKNQQIDKTYDVYCFSMMVGPIIIIIRELKY